MPRNRNSAGWKQIYNEPECPRESASGASLRVARATGKIGGEAGGAGALSPKSDPSLYPPSAVAGAGVNVRRFVRRTKIQETVFELDSTVRISDGCRGQKFRASRFGRCGVLTKKSVPRVPSSPLGAGPLFFPRRVRGGFSPIAPTPRLILRIRGSSLPKKVALHAASKSSRRPPPGANSSVEVTCGERFGGEEAASLNDGHSRHHRQLFQWDCPEDH